MSDYSQIGGNAANIGLAAAQGFANPLTDVTAGIGLGQTLIGLTGLSKIPDRVAPSIDPQVKAMVDRSLAMAKAGYSPEEITNFHNQMAQQAALKYQHATDTAGGNLAQATNAGINAGNTNALNTFAAQDAKLKQVHQQYADQTVKYLQGLENQDWQKNEAFRQGLQNSWGGVAKSGLSTLTGALEAGAAGYRPSTSPQNIPSGGGANFGEYDENGNGIPTAPLLGGGNNYLGKGVF